MKNFTLIERDFQVTDFQRYLSNNDIKILAYDFEQESNLHVYGQKICLIQIYDGTTFFIIDPFRISRDKLAELLEDKKIIKLFFAADSDLSFAYLQYNIKVKSVFDLQIMVDLLEFEKKGLDEVLLKVLGVEHKNKSKYQRFNWTVRPIREDALEYALTDVEHLIRLHDELLKMIDAAGLTHNLLHTVIKRRNEFDSKTVPTAFRSFEYKSLNQQQRKRFESIYAIRDSFARKLNCPPDCVLNKKQMAEIAMDSNYIAQLEFSKRVPEHYYISICDALRNLT
jgi:ribonuclease D